MKKKESMKRLPLDSRFFVREKSVRLKSCKYCGRVHKQDFDCGKRPKYKRYNKNATDAIRYTAAWKRKSAEIKERTHYLCSVCLEQNTYMYDEIETHHIIKITERPDLLLEDWNLIALCRRHHEMAERGELGQDMLFSIAKKRDEIIPPVP